MILQLRIMRRKFLIAVALPVVAGCLKTGPNTSNTARIQLNWYPEAEHGGFYAALVHGDYRDEGLDVEILPGTPNTKVAVQVATGRAAFGVLNADELLQARAQGMDVGGVLASMQVCPHCIVVHKESGIGSFDQLKNVEILALGAGATYADYLKKHVDLSGVTIVPYQGGISQFLANDRYAQQGYLFSEPYLIEQRGRATNVLKVADLGYNPYAGVLFTSRKLINDRPDFVRKVVHAAARGWKRYLSDHVMTNKYIQGLNPEMTAEALDYGANELRKLVAPDSSSRIGAMTKKRWVELSEQMSDIGHLEKDTTTVAAFTNEFLPADP